MSAIHPSLFGKTTKDNFPHIYAGLSSFFIAAGYQVSSGPFRMPAHDGLAVYDLRPKDWSLEQMVATVSNFVRDVWGLEIAQFPIKGQKAVALQLRMPKPKKRRR